MIIQRIVLHFVSHATLLLRKCVACDAFVLSSRHNFLVLAQQNRFAVMFDANNSCRTMSLISREIVETAV